MNVLRNSWPIALVACLPLGGAVRADEPPAATSETAETVIARYVEALGGADALAKSEAYHLVGRFEQTGIVGRIDVWAAEGDRYRMKLDVEGMGTFEEGFHEGVGWSNDPMSGPQVMTGDHLLSTRLRAAYNAELRYFELYRDVAYQGQVDFEGDLCHKLRLETPWATSFQYFAVDSGLLRGSEGELPIGGGHRVPLTLVVHGYEEHGGRLYPRKTSQTTPMGEQTITIESADTRPVAAETFDPPPAVRARLDQQPKTGPAEGSPD